MTATARIVRRESNPAYRIFYESLKINDEKLKIWGYIKGELM
ncbi:hypothetical protein HCH_03877 [Hahella chejuensis KCTC 2396]|uniref:Uncharacterized protein n=1 Tax=Hahella chejuensis (strain KCTC 2396) TaxID=349521 RepID=Q2SFH0_HAHCH|nr:hypothetical protein HCH_03877 [Hahella chejuensis KCTC 2396]